MRRETLGSRYPSTLGSTKRLGCSVGWRFIKAEGDLRSPKAKLVEALLREAKPTGAGQLGPRLHGRPGLRDLKSKAGARTEGKRITIIVIPYALAFMRVAVA